MSRLRKAVLALAVLVVLLVVAAAVFVATFDANRYRSIILAQLSGSLNRPVEAATLELRLLPLRLRLNQVRVKEDPNFAGEEFVRAQAVQFDLSLGSLLRGDPEVQALELVEPTLYLRQEAGGRWNVATLAAPPEAAPGTPPPAAPPPAPPPIPNWLVQNGTVVIEPAGQPPVRLTGVELAVTDLSTTKPFPFHLSVSFAPQSRLSAQGLLGPLDLSSPARTPLEAEVNLENFRPAALGSLVAVPPSVAKLGALDGTLKANSKPEQLRVAGTVTLLGREAQDNVAVQLAAAFPADFSRVELDESGVEYRGARVTGSGRVALAPATQFDLKLKTAGADLQSLWALPARLGLALPRTFGAAPPATGQLTADVAVSGTPEAWQLNGTAKLRDLAVPLQGLAQPVRIPSLELTLEPERLVAAPFAVSPESGLNLTLAGAVTNYRTQPLLEARVGGGEVAVAPLVALAGRFGVKLLGEGQQLSGLVQPALELSGPLAEPARLSYRGTLTFRNLSLTLRELAKPVAVPALTLELDPQRLVASPFSVVLEPGVTLTLAGTVEDYRGAARLKAQVTGEEVPIEPLLALATRFGKNPLGQGQKLSGRVRPALHLSGPLVPQSGTAKLSYEGTLALREATLVMPPLPEPVRIPTVELALNPTRLSAEPFTAQLGEKLRARVDFRLENYQTKPVLRARVTTEGAELEALVGLARALGTDPLPGGKAAGRVTAAIDVSGLLEEKAPPLALAGQAQLSTATVQLAELTAPLVIEQASVEFSRQHLGVTNLRLAAAGAKVQGSVRVDNFDAPSVRFDLRGDTLDVEALQALFGAQPAAPATPPRRRAASVLSLPVVHAQEKPDDWFARLSGRGRLAFERVRHGTFTLTSFSAPLTIANQVVTGDPIEFGLYDGGGRGRLVVDLRGAEPVTEFNGLLRNVDANKLLSENSDSKNRLYGRLGGTLAVKFAGRERRQINPSARGQGQLTLVNGRLAHVNLSRELVLLGQLAGLSYERRDTPIEDMTTEFEIADGWVRTRDLTLRTPDLTMTAAGGFSLDDELAFESTATFTPEASAEMTQRSPLGALTGSIFTDEDGRVVIPFLVRGTLAQPKFTLDAARLAEMKLRRRTLQPGGTLSDILERLRKRKDRPQ